MPKRFEQYYRTKRLDNLGDPDWHDRRWQDIDLRMANRELDSTRIDDAVDRMEAVALARLNETFRPIIEQAHALLAECWHIVQWTVVDRGDGRCRDEDIHHHRAVPRPAIDVSKVA